MLALLADITVGTGLLSLIALAIFIYAIYCLFTGRVALGIVLIVVAAAVGPGGWSLTAH